MSYYLKFLFYFIIGINISFLLNELSKNIKKLRTKTEFKTRILNIK